MPKSLEVIVIPKTVSSTLKKREIGQLVAQYVKELLRPTSKLKGKARRQLAQAQSLTLVLVGEKEGRTLNRQYRHKDYATDVLSFAPIEPESLGELVFCVPVIRKQAKEHGLTPQQEFAYLLIHGILHLLGYDHEKNDKQAAAMYRLQDKLFAKVSHVSRHPVIRRKK